MRIELKNVKVYPDLLQETTCFTATVYVDGAKAGIVENRGHGGSNFYYWTDRAAGERAVEWAKTQTLEFDFEHLDQVISRLFDKHEARQQLARYARKETLFRLVGDPRGEWRSVKLPFTPSVEASIRRTYGDAIEVIANLDLEAALDYC